MKRFTEKAAGRGVTRHKDQRTTYQFPVTRQEAVELGEALKSIGDRAAPWRWLEREIAIAARTLTAIEQGAPGSDDPEIFKPYVGAGWFSKEILDRAKWIESAKASGNGELVARFAFELGRLAATVRMGNAWNDDIEAALHTEDRRRQGGINTRQRSDEERFECWTKHFVATGKKTEADRLASEELGDGESTIRKARMKFAAHASD